MLGETLGRRSLAVWNHLADKWFPILATNASERECERRERNGSLGMLAVAALILIIVAATFVWPDLLRESGQPHPKLMLWILRTALTACAASFGFLAGDSILRIRHETRRDREVRGRR